MKLCKGTTAEKENVPGNVAEREVGKEGSTEQDAGHGSGVVSSVSMKSPARRGHGRKFFAAAMARGSCEGAGCRKRKKDPPLPYL